MSRSTQTIYSKAWQSRGIIIGITSSLLLVLGLTAAQPLPDTSASWLADAQAMLATPHAPEHAPEVNSGSVVHPPFNGGNGMVVLSPFAGDNGMIVMSPAEPQEPVPPGAEQ